MFRFFASLKRFLATEAAYEALGAVVQYAIQKLYIPFLEQEKTLARPEDTAKYEALIQDFERASNDRNPESRQWADLSRMIMLGLRAKWNQPKEVMEEMAQDLAGDLYGDRQHNADLGKFNPVTGVLGLRQFWSRILDNKAKNRAREIGRKEHHTQQMPEYETEEMSVPSEKPVDKIISDELMSKDVLSDLKEYVRRSVRSSLSRDVFEWWMGIAADKGADSVVLEHDIVKPIMEGYAKQGEPVTRTDVYGAWADVRKLIVQFFERELDIRFSEAQKRRLHLSSVDAITCDVFRNRLAKWVLGR